MKPLSCYLCHQIEGEPDKDHAPKKVELRPYGPNGEPVCFPCAMKPANIGTTKRIYAARLAAAGPTAQLTPEGPIPMIVPGRRR